MNINTKTTRALIAVAIMLGVSIWIINAIRPRFYEGANLEFPVMAGAVQLTNSSDALTVQLVSDSSRSFRVSSPSNDISGGSTRLAEGNITTQIFEFELPSGNSEFSVSSSGNIRFEAVSATSLTATVYPLNYGAMQLRIIGLIVLVIAMLFYISQLYDHNWISAARRQTAVDDIAAQNAEQENFDRIMENRTSKKRP